MSLGSMSWFASGRRASQGSSSTKENARNRRATRFSSLKQQLQRHHSEGDTEDVSIEHVSIPELHVHATRRYPLLLYMYVVASALL